VPKSSNSSFWEDDAAAVPAGGSQSFWEDDVLPEPEKPFLQQKLEGIKAFATEGSIGGQIPILGPLAQTVGRTAAAGLAKATFDDRKFGDIYNEMVEEETKKEREFIKKHPVAAVMQGVVGGAMAPVPNLGIAKAVTGAGKIAGAARGALSVTDNALPAAATMYADTGLRTMNEEKAEGAGKDAGMIAAGMQIIPRAIGVAGRGIARLTTGIKGKTIDKYQARRGAINSLTEEEAMGELEGAARAVREKGDDLVTGAQQKARNARESAIIESQNVRQTALEKARRAEESGKYQAEELTRNVADDLVEGVGQARKKIGQASGEAFEVLGKSGKTIPLTGAKDVIDKRIARFKIGAAIPDTPEVKILQKYRQLLDDVGQEDISPTDFKKLIQVMDSEIEDSYAKLRAGERLTSGDRELMGARAGIDDYLKNPETGVPGYQEAMAPVAKKTGIVSRLNENIPNRPDAAFGRLKNVLKPGSQDKARSIQEFEEEFGGDYLGRLRKADELRSRDYASEASPDLQRAEQMMKEDFAPYFADEVAEGKRLSGVTQGFGEKQSQGVLKRFGNSPEKNIDIGRRFDALAEENLKINPQSTFNPRQLADDLAVKRAFETSYSQGSRNVNLGALSLAGLAKMMGVSLEAIPGLGAVGAILGAAADRGGPQAVKAILDAIAHPKARKFAKMYGDAMKRLPQGAVRANERLSEETP